MEDDTRFLALMRRHFALDAYMSEVRRMVDVPSVEAAVNREVRRICAEHFPEMDPPVFKAQGGDGEREP